MKCAGLLLVLLHGFAWCACMERADSQRFLHEDIGNPHVAEYTPHSLTCDTVVIREGDTVRVFPAARIYFGSPAGQQSILLVKGVLVVEGTSKNPVYLAGNMQANSFDMLVPNHELWGGIRVSTTGTVVVKHARVFGAPILISSESERVKLDSVYVEDANYMIGPAGKQWKLNPAGTKLFGTSFSNGVSGSSHAVGHVSQEKNAPQNFKPEVSSSTQHWRPWAYGLGAGALVAGMGAGLWFTLQNSNGGNSQQVSAYPENLEFANPVFGP